MARRSLPKRGGGGLSRVAKAKAKAKTKAKAVAAWFNAGAGAKAEATRTSTRVEPKGERNRITDLGEIACASAHHQTVTRESSNNSEHVYTKRASFAR